MTISLKHHFSSAKSDSGDATLVQPSNWNAEHDMTMAASSLLGNSSGSSGNVSEIGLGAGLSFSAGTLVNGAFIPFGAATLNNQTAQSETSVALWNIPANYLAAGQSFVIQVAGQVSSTATLTFRVRIGTAGTSADALVIQFGTTGAGVANQHILGHIFVYVISSTTMSGGGIITQGQAIVGQTTAAFAAATIDATVANKLSVNLSQSANQTYTSRFATCNRTG